MGVPTSLADVELNEKDVDVILASLERHGMVALGEHQDITLPISREILNTAL
ncbi:hypothetical protein [Photobacterium leiognathi]